LQAFVVNSALPAAGSPMPGEASGGGATLPPPDGAQAPSASARLPARTAATKGRASAGQ
jgi:hypothetical protein